MAARARRGSGSAASTKEIGKDDWLERRIENIREATGAAEEDIRVMLAECNNDVDEATSRLIDSAPCRFAFYRGTSACPLMVDDL